jgi:hypothetical protein
LGESAVCVFFVFLFFFIDFVPMGGRREKQNQFGFTSGKMTRDGKLEKLSDCMICFFFSFVSVII